MHDQYLTINLVRLEVVGTSQVYWIMTVPGPLILPKHEVVPEPIFMGYPLFYFFFITLLKEMHTHEKRHSDFLDITFVQINK